MDKNLEIATFGAGCFWGVEEAFKHLEGVKNTAAGFMGGTVENPSYERVCKGDTGHAEVLHLEYNSQEISFEDLLKKFWKVHDPTQVNQQGPDVGKQYRSIIFYHTPEQKTSAEKSKMELEQSGKYSKPIATEIVPAGSFYKAEEHHQQYLENKA